MNENKQQIIKTINQEHKQAKKLIIEAMSFLDKSKSIELVEWLNKIAKVENNFNFINMFIISNYEEIYDYYDFSEEKQEIQIIANVASKMAKTNENIIVPLFLLQESDFVDIKENQTKNWDFYSLINLISVSKNNEKSKNDFIITQNLKHILLKIFKENNIVVSEFDYEDFGLGFMVYNDNAKNNKYEMFINSKCKTEEQVILLLHEYTHYFLGLVSFSNKAIVENEAIVELIVYLLLAKLDISHLNNKYFKYLNLFNFKNYWNNEVDISKKLKFINMILNKSNAIYNQIKKILDLKSKINKIEK